MPRQKYFIFVGDQKKVPINHHQRFEDGEHPSRDTAAPHSLLPKAPGSFRSTQQRALINKNHKSFPIHTDHPGLLLTPSKLQPRTMSSNPRATPRASAAPGSAAAPGLISKSGIYMALYFSFAVQRMSRVPRSGLQIHTARVPPAPSHPHGVLSALPSALPAELFDLCRLGKRDVPQDTFPRSLRHKRVWKLLDLR